ncbi:S9 family peptidase [soil metagenome]
MKHQWSIAVGILAMALQPPALLAQPASDPAALFGARETVEQASLSPDGRYIAMVGPLEGQGSALFVADSRVEGEFVFKRILTADGNPNRMGRCDWTSPTRLICNSYAISQLANAEIGYVARYFALDVTGANLKQLENPTDYRASQQYLQLTGGSIIDRSPGEEGAILMERYYTPEISLGNRGAETREGLAVDRIDTNTLKASNVERPRKDAYDYITDGRGEVRVMALNKPEKGYAGDVMRFMYRPADRKDWFEFSHYTFSTKEGFRPVAVDGERNIAYGFKKVDGHLQAWTKALDASGKEALVYAHPQVDVSGYVTLGRERRLVGVSYATDKREVYYFDPAVAALVKSLAKALPQLPLIHVVDSDVSGQRLLIFAGSDIDPGRYFLFDRTTRKLDLITLARPALKDMALPAVRSVSYPASDGTMIPAYLTLPPGKDAKGLPAIVLAQGGPEARDAWGFDWLSAYFAAQGYAVLRPSFRGSAGYGDRWFQDNGFKSWRIAVGDVDDGGRWLIAQGVDPSRLGVIGWSYGGYAALQSQVLAPDLFKAVVAIAPVTDLERMASARRSWDNYLLVSDYVGTGKHIEEGSPARHAGQFKAPVLLFHGTLDRNVLVDQSRLMDSRLKDAGKRSSYVEYKGYDHYLDDSAVRAELLRKSDEFLKSSMGG